MESDFILNTPDRFTTLSLKCQQSRSVKYVFNTVSSNIFILSGRLKYKGVNMKSEILKYNGYLIYGLFMIIIIAADYGSPHTYTNLNISFR